MAAENKSSFVFELVIGMIALILYLSAFTLHKNYNYDYTPTATDETMHDATVATTDSTAAVESYQNQSDISESNNQQSNTTPRETIANVSGWWNYPGGIRYYISQSGYDLSVEVYSAENFLASTGTGSVSGDQVTLKIYNEAIGNMKAVAQLSHDEQSMIGSLAVTGTNYSENFTLAR